MSSTDSQRLLDRRQDFEMLQSKKKLCLISFMLEKKSSFWCSNPYGSKKLYRVKKNWTNDGCVKNFFHINGFEANLNELKSHILPCPSCVDGLVE